MTTAATAAKQENDCDASNQSSNQASQARILTYINKKPENLFQKQKKSLETIQLLLLLLLLWKKQKQKQQQSVNN